MATNNQPDTPLFFNSSNTRFSYSSALSSLAHNLAGTAQDVSYSYTRNQVREIVGHSWTNDLYQWSEAANGTQSYISNGLNQYTTAAGAALGYDTKGNLAGDGVWSYTYDADNKLKSASKTGYSASLAYDPEGRLSQTSLAGTTTDLLYDGVDLVAEYDGTGILLRRYVHGPGVDDPLVWYEGSTTADKTWLYADHQGSIVGTADDAGASSAIYSYGPFGEPNVSTGVRFRYTGQQLLGDLNLYYYKARFYSPALGRFLQTDPIGSVDDLNLYAYVGNNPVNFVDPSGLVAAEAKMLYGRLSDSTGGQLLLGLVPGHDLYTAIRDPNATLFDYGIGVLGVFPGAGKAGGLVLRAGDDLVGAVAKSAPTSRAARREAMRDAGIPTSQQPVSQSRNASGREYSYEVPAPGGGAQRMSVQQQTMDRSHTGQAHWEAGRVKTDPRTGAVRENGKKKGHPSSCCDIERVSGCP